MRTGPVRLPLVFGPQHLYKVEKGFTQVPYDFSIAHFADLLERYSAPVMVLDLTKHHEKREREMIVSSEYRTAIEYLNSNMTMEQRIQYCALDFR